MRNFLNRVEKRRSRSPLDLSDSLARDADFSSQTLESPPGGASIVSHIRAEYAL